MDGNSNQAKGLPDNFSFQEMSTGEGTGAISQSFDFVDLTSVNGSDPLRFVSQGVSFRRFLYKVEGIDIKWIGIVIPTKLFLEPMPHIFFHPSAGQAGILDGNYGKMSGGWLGVYDAYSFWMGAQIAAAATKIRQALVIPLYKSAQALNLGNFNRFWKPVIAELLTDALMKKDPLLLRTNRFSFTKICTSSFSIGIAVHKHFQSKGAEVAGMTDKIFDLDGKFGPGHWSFWRPGNGIIYQDRPVSGPNPTGNVYHLGRRWDNAFMRQSREGRHRDTHWLTNQFMLYHGLMTHSAA